ncbi:MAG: GGDEF domain-containing protein [Acidobacteria bacterium]|nr:MAG: GGDEF domain-containing protein [Acidobacteriota bacterium]
MNDDQPLQFPTAEPAEADSAGMAGRSQADEEAAPAGEDLRRAMRAVAAREVPVGSLFLGLLLTIQGGVAIAADPVSQSAAAMLLSVGLALVIAGVVLRRVEIRPGAAHAVAMLVALVALAALLLHFAVERSMQASLHHVLAQVTAVLLFVSPRWYSVFVAASIVGWLTIARTTFGPDEWAALGPALLVATAIGIVLQVRRARSLTRITAFWLQQQARARELESAVHRAARSQEELAELSVRDPLTGAYNRRFLQRLEEQLERPTATWGCLLLDLDDFKTVNDRFGHDEGDRVLQGVAHFVRRQGRADDNLVRLGGDEFALFMEVKTEEELHLAADRLERVAKEESPCPFSVGRAYRRPGESLKTVLQRADAEMYRQKRRRGSGKTLRMRPIVR